MKPKILITGGAGLLAINWALAIRNHYSVILGLHDREILLAGIESRHVGLESVEQIMQTLEAVCPQIVIHAAGLTNVEVCEANPALAHHINVELAVNVAQACAKSGLKLVHISTDHLFSGELSLADEGQQTAPVNVYGRTKAEAESRILEAYPQTVVIRTNFYGWGPGYRRSFSDMIIGSLRARKKLTLFKDVFYTPILIEVAALAVHDLVNLKACGIFHVVGDERISKYEFGLRVAQKFDLDSSLIASGSLGDQTSLVQRPRDMSLSNKKTCNWIGKNLGGIDEHLTMLNRQEKAGLAREIQAQST